MAINMGESNSPLIYSIGPFSSSQIFYSFLPNKNSPKQTYISRCEPLAQAPRTRGISQD